MANAQARAAACRAYSIDHQEIIINPQHYSYSSSLIKSENIIALSHYSVYETLFPCP